MDKIRFRLVFNRQKRLNKQGTALVQVEASLNGRHIYIKTNVYLKPECWDRTCAQVINHPQSYELNAMLYETILEFQAIELSFWKRGIESTLSNLKESVKKGIKPSVSFLKFSRNVVENSNRKQSTKNNIYTTLTLLKEFRVLVDFSDLTYAFLKDFELFLRNKSLETNTVYKHMRQLRTLVNESINQGYINQQAYPFRKYKMRQERKEHNFLIPDELKLLENLTVDSIALRHTLDAFLFCCYCGLRFSDFKAMTKKNLVSIDENLWLCLKCIKTGTNTNLPIYLLFNGKALKILNKYGNLEALAKLKCNSDTNRNLNRLREIAKIDHKITFHTARHTCATLLVHQGVAITTVQKLLGHTSVKTTQIYSEVMNDTIIKDLAKANNKANSIKQTKRNNVNINSI